jgi:hypothetical protein
MSPRVAPLRRLWSESWSLDGALVALLTLVLVAAFPNEIGNPNAKSRLFLALSIVERGSLSIGDYAPVTIDRSMRDGQAYSDKAPGMAILALPTVALLHDRLARHADGTPCAGRECWFVADSSAQGFSPFRNYVLLQHAAILTVAPLIMLAVALFRALLVVLYDDRRAATLAAIGLVLATPFGMWAATFYEHALSAALLTIGLVAAHATTRLAVPRPPGWLAGLLVAAPLALAVPVSYPATGAGALIALYALWGARDAGGRWLIQAAGAALAVGAIVAIPLMAYNAAAFGGPLRISYGSVVGFEGMQRGLFGITLPDPAVIWQLLVPQYRGLIWVAPVALLYPVALVLVLARRPDLRGVILLSLAIVVYYLALNGGYYYWEGGHSLGPRHLTPILPFVMLTVAGIPALWGRRGAVLFAVPLVLGAVVIVGALATRHVTVPDDNFAPIATILLPDLLSGRLTTGIVTAQALGARTSFVLAALLILAILVPLLVRNARPVRDEDEVPEPAPGAARRHAAAGRPAG